MAYLRNLTITANEPTGLADFYRAVFELNTVSEESNLIRLSDVIFTLAPTLNGRSGQPWIPAAWKINAARNHVG